MNPETPSMGGAGRPHRSLRAGQDIDPQRLGLKARPEITLQWRTPGSRFRQSSGARRLFPNGGSSAS